MARLRIPSPHRSIPAPAGEPRANPAVAPPHTVYPRACGGTEYDDLERQLISGLSPRLRGNHAITPSMHHAVRSIPAPAGEPFQHLVVEFVIQVYPRACGGTLPFLSSPGIRYGLSPRLRGNPQLYIIKAVQIRSIPAPAGEPRRGDGNDYICGVYPRACGGTTFHPNRSAASYGLSPRLRGNPKSTRTPLIRAGSIPAPAGEPPVVDVQSPAVGVYPRACGGTDMRSDTEVYQAGLSPRLRGNHHLPKD